VKHHASKNGVLFQLSPPASGSGLWTEDVLFRFPGLTYDAPDGFCPQGLTVNNGVLYGIAPKGGTGNFGTVFEATF
jgi:hypothetical protein